MIETDIGCGDEYGYPLHAPQPEIEHKVSTRSDEPCLAGIEAMKAENVILHQQVVLLQRAIDAQQYENAALKVENAALRAELAARCQDPAFVAQWEAGKVAMLASRACCGRTMPARALRGGDGMPR